MIREWRNRRYLRKMLRERHVHWSTFPVDLAVRLDNAGWNLLYVTEHGIRCWIDGDGFTHYYGAEFATPEQIAYTVAVLGGKEPPVPEGVMPDDALSGLLLLDALTILGE